MPAASRELELPLESEDLWIELGNVPLARPLMQGDVFEGAGSHDGLDVIITHPCSMRAGARLRPRQTLVRVAGMKPPDDESLWQDHYYDYMPLKGLTHSSIGGGFPAADFRMIASIETACLVRDSRVASMSHDGIHRLQQRLAAYLTRAVIDIPTLSRTSEAVLAEADLQEEWVDAATGHLEEEEVETALVVAEAEFQNFLDGEDRRLRLRLEEAHTRPDAIREIRRRIQQST